MRVLGWIADFFTGLGWVAGSLAFVALSLAIVLGMAFAIRLAFPFLPNFAAALAMLASFVIYVGVVGRLGRRYLARKMNM